MRKQAVAVALVVALACGAAGLVFFTSACGGGSPADPDGDAPLVLAAGSTRLAPTAAGAAIGGLDLARLGVTTVTWTYDLTTPAGEPFVFDLLSRAPGNRGGVRVAVAHVTDAGVVPTAGPVTIAQAGVIAAGPGRAADGYWLAATGDGFARLTLRGAIDREQVFVVRGGDGTETTTALVRLRIGPPGIINLAARSGSDYPGVLEERTLYSSDSWMFGLPTVAVSGDRTSVVCYEGDRASPDRYDRYEMRMQVDHATGVVTGGGSAETSPDSGNWRDHEIAALYNVLALVHSGSDRVTLKLSYDRGATFAQTETFGASSLYSPRLVQIAMALDYGLVLLYWRANADGTTDLVMVEGRPSAFDGGGSPTAFSFDPPQVLHHAFGDVTPTLMGATFSEGGDLVVGYAYSSFTIRPDRTWVSRTQNRCIVRPWGGAAVDTLVEESVIVGRDPSVAVVGQGPTLRVFYAYETDAGVVLATSDDQGATFTFASSVLEPGAFMPTVFARDLPGGLAVDLLYLAYAGEGLELHLRHWADFDAGAYADHRLTTATTTGGGLPYPVPGPVPGVGVGGDVGVDVAPPPDFAFTITQVAFFGYDAVLDGDEIVVVYDEETIDGYVYGPLPLPGGLPEPAPAAGGPEGDFVAAQPPPLAPGMTEPVPGPDPLHRHQLRWLRIL